MYISCTFFIVFIYFCYSLFASFWINTYGKTRKSFSSAAKWATAYSSSWNNGRVFSLLTRKFSFVSYTKTKLWIQEIRSTTYTCITIQHLGYDIKYIAVMNKGDVQKYKNWKDNQIYILSRHICHKRSN